ncbi:hypothetical protein IC608_09990 [Devosia sp. PTR5]|uniref:2-keto-4-pentenoate hydratase n=1 Tax=Devosia oryzisoli TaxID=2774138 RepID=A0A927ITK8_9HYPH|nr:hypothetical protein [Devosia oryzisoli]MBD8065806.1 hypothetical protein [Devosia oryzisoli]
MIDSLSALAQALIAAHDGGPLVADVPDHLVPADLDAVYALQDAIIERTGPVGGWKVAAGVGDPPICSPIPKNRYFDNRASIDGKRHRFVIAELEIAVMLGADIAAGSDRATIAEAIGSIHPALELIGSPFPDRDAMARNLQLGDLQSNGAVVVGPAVADTITGKLETLPAALWHDGAEAKAVANGASWTTTLDALAWLAGHAASRGLPLRAGQIIITGARPVAPIGEATTIEGRVEGYGVVSATIG